MDPDGIDVVVFDYGDVLSLNPPQEDRRRMERLAGVPADDLWSAYWQERRAYDGGITAAEYWTRVAARAGAEWDTATLHGLWALDVGSWLHVREGTARVLGTLGRRGVRTALLSNAPTDIAGALRTAPVMAGFDALYFSAELGVCKPDPAIYEHVLGEMGTAAGRTAFVDDREENVLAAKRLGLTTHHYTGDDGLVSFLAEHGLIDTPGRTAAAG
ncbi:HAD family hydrolase [Streptomonospora salina]|uniref:Putative hydrolase of the HAD superfamily n=1 Tax=Streptomonospora salina TaxID=104205 RepID=A0A841EI11_9ACTN|nr:HAD family phosphatase [Streptomonospora salina]MBB6000458.1 putative hydrolase of the HAD superfamily [Streptomonospora salina]